MSKMDPEQYPKLNATQRPVCTICHKQDPKIRFVCFRCGAPLHYEPDGQCGTWELMPWHPDAEDENRFLCLRCLEIELREQGVHIRFPRPETPGYDSDTGLPHWLSGILNDAEQAGQRSTPLPTADLDELFLAEDDEDLP